MVRIQAKRLIVRVKVKQVILAVSPQLLTMGEWWGEGVNYACVA